MSEHTHHRTGIPGEYRMTARFLAEWAAAIAESHEPSADMPEATVCVDSIMFSVESSKPIPEHVLRP